jgi:nicotinate-nucleotide adenylyltransferase
MRIGICGGTFDPFHCGHLHPVLAAREAIGWDRIIYVPAYVQPFKTDRATASALDRFAMTVLATEEHDDVYVSKLELERGEISYTVDTLEALHSAHPEAALDWIIGDDNLAELQKWRNLDRIFELASFVVLTRGRAEVPNELKNRPIAFARNATVPVSSTDIRRRVRAGEPIDELVDPRVSHYIHHYRLYEEDLRD